MDTRRPGGYQYPDQGRAQYPASRPYRGGPSGYREGYEHEEGEWARGLAGHDARSGGWGQTSGDYGQGSMRSADWDDRRQRDYGYERGFEPNSGGWSGGSPSRDAAYPRTFQGGDPAYGMGQGGRSGHREEYGREHGGSFGDRERYSPSPGYDSGYWPGEWGQGFGGGAPGGRRRYRDESGEPGYAGPYLEPRGAHAFDGYGEGGYGGSGGYPRGGDARLSAGRGTTAPWSAGGQDRFQRGGRAPKGYTRSDERIREDVNDRLMQSDELDPSEIEVSVSRGEVTLAGTVASRDEKFRAEQLAESVSGVKDVTNQLRIHRAGQRSAGNESDGRSGATGEPERKTGTGSTQSAASGSTTSR